MIKSKKIYMLGLITASLLVGCGGSTSSGDNDNNDDDKTSISTHHQGQACLECHKEGTNGAPKLKAGGTVYTLLTAVDGTSNLATGHLIQLKMASDDTLVKFLAGNGTGNSNLKTTTITASDTFTAQVVDANGKVVKSSGTATHNGERLNCNACHTATGKNDAPGRIINK